MVISKVDRFLVNLRPGPVELLLCLAQALFGLWLLLGAPPGAYALLSGLMPFWAWGLLTLAVAVMHVTSAFMHRRTARRVLSFVGCCMWTFVAVIVASVPLLAAPPYAFLFAFASGWVYIKLSFPTEEEA